MQKGFMDVNMCHLAKLAELRGKSIVFLPKKVLGSNYWRNLPTTNDLIAKRLRNCRYHDDERSITALRVYLKFAKHIVPLFLILLTRFKGSK